MNIFGEMYVINCRIKTMDYFSAHADQSELIDYLSLNEVKKLERMFLVHGEEEQALALREKLVGLGYRSVNILVWRKICIIAWESFFSYNHQMFLLY